MGLSFRTIRAAASALLVSAAVGTGGMTGMSSALAAGPAMVGLAGHVVDAAGGPLGGVHLVISEELPPDGGFAGFHVTTSADGSFAADVYAWGTADAPASLTISTPADEEITVIGQACSQTWGVAVAVHQDLALAESKPDPLTLTATTTLLGEVCGTTATPPPNTPRGGGGANLTPPPTDTVSAPVTGPADRLGPAMTIGFLVGLLVTAAALLPRPGARRRD